MPILQPFPRAPGAPGAHQRPRIFSLLCLFQGLENHLYNQYEEKVRPCIDLIDSLRALGVEQDLALPAIAVIGDQSSGKSSVLEALSGVSLPRGSGKRGVASFSPGQQPPPAGHKASVGRQWWPRLTVGKVPRRAAPVGPGQHKSGGHSPGRRAWTTTLPLVLQAPLHTAVPSLAPNESRSRDPAVPPSWSV